MGSGGSNEVHKKWSDFIHILKVEPIEVVFKQKVDCKRKWEAKDDASTFGLNNKKFKKLAFTKTEKSVSGTGF